MIRRSVALFVPLVLTTAVPSRAQSVHGRATVPGTAAPVAGAIVALVDSAGAVMSRTLTSERGEYRLRAPAPGLYRLRALRIGFRPSESASFALVTGQTLERSIELTGAAVSLAAVEVSADRRCDVNPEASSAAFSAWEEARKALDAALLTRTGRGYWMEIVRHVRQVSPRTSRVLTESETELRGPAERPFVTPSPARIDSAGYVQVDSGASVIFAPDEEVLLSESFAATHCFRLADADSAGEIALAFEPVEARKLPDIRGTITLDRTTAALRRLQFVYVHVSDAVESQQGGGVVYFSALPQGGWIIPRWSMRFPVFEHITDPRQLRGGDVVVMGRGVRPIALTAIQESGGEVIEVIDRDSVLWQVDRPPLVGTIRDDTGAVVVGATIAIPNLGVRVLSDSGGRFTIPHLRPARRVLLVSTPLLDSLGTAPLEREVDSRHPGVARVKVPFRDAAMAAACDKPLDWVRLRGVIHGIMRDSTGRPLAGVTVRANWIQIIPTPGDEVEPSSGSTLWYRYQLEADSRADGHFLICGVGLDRPIELTSAVGGARVRVGNESRILLLDLPVRPATP